MPGSWWCCCKDCWSWDDNFDRADSTNVGSGWDEAGGVGDWEIDDRNLYESGTATSRILSTQPVPADSEGEMVISVVIRTDLAAFTTGDEFTIYGAWKDSGNYIKAVFTKLAASLTWNVEIFDVTTPIVDSDMISSDLDGDLIHAYLCVDSDGSVKAGMTSTSEPPWGDTSDQDGRYHGLGHDNTVTGGRFDNYAIEEVRRNGKICQYCWCPCLDVAPDQSLIATFTDATDRSACLGGGTIDLDWVYHAGTPSWDGVGVGTDMDSFSLVLRCIYSGSQEASHPGQNFSLAVNGGGSSGSCCRTGCFLSPLSTSTCDPLNLIFGPFSMASSDLVCDACYDPLVGPVSGEYYIVVTDR